MRKTLRAVPLLMTLLLIGACTPGDAVPEGGIVTDRSNRAREDRVVDYLWYLEQDPPRSPAWVDQRACVSEAAFGTTAALGRRLFPTSAGATIAATSIQMAEDIGDPDLLAVAEMTEGVGRDLASGHYNSMREAIGVSLALCTVTELDDSDIEDVVQAAIDTEIAIIASLGLEPWLGPDGTPPGTIQNPPSTEQAAGNEGCTADTIAVAIIDYASGAISREDALAAAGAESSSEMSDWLDYIDDAVSANPGVDPATLLGGGATLTGLCG